MQTDISALTSLSYKEIRKGIPGNLVKKLLKQQVLTRLDVYSIIPERTFARRLAEKKKLKISESDAIARLVRTVHKAQETFGNSELAQQWLRQPNSILGNEAPIIMARTDAGAREVEAELDRFAYGDYS